MTTFKQALSIAAGELTLIQEAVFSPDNINARQEEHLAQIKAHGETANQTVGKRDALSAIASSRHYYAELAHKKALAAPGDEAAFANALSASRFAKKKVSDKDIEKHNFHSNSAKEHIGEVNKLTTASGDPRVVNNFAARWKNNQDHGLHLDAASAHDAARATLYQHHGRFDYKTLSKKAQDLTTKTNI